MTTNSTTSPALRPEAETLPIVSATHLWYAPLT
jgi:hypothetical protein